MTRLEGSVVDAGGGQVTVTVNRDTDHYPPVGTPVDVTYTTPAGPTCHYGTCANTATHDGALPVAPVGTPRAKACPHHLAGLVHVRALDPAARVQEWLDSDDGSGDKGYLDDTVHDMADDLRAVLDELKAHRADLTLAASLARDLGHRARHLAEQIDNPADLT